MKLPGDFVAKRFANLRDAKGQLAAARRQDVRKVNEDTLRCFRAEIDERSLVIFGRRANVCAKHEIKRARFS